MTRKTRLSRFNPAYLAARHGGMALLLLALGILAGVAYMKCAAPRMIEAEASVSIRAFRNESGQIFDWEDKGAEWERFFSEPDTLRLIAGNIRYAVKAAFTRNNREPDDAEASFRRELLSFRTPRLFSTSAGAFGGTAYCGPELRVSRHDIVANIDFQTLARIVCDLDPPGAATGWDALRRATPFPGNDFSGEMVGVPGPDDRFFQPLYSLYTLLHNDRNASDPETAWRAAIEEVADRLARESEFAGTGGFGEKARLELSREFRAMPLLIANGLYDAGGFGGSSGNGMWRRRWSGGWRSRVDWTGNEAALNLAFGDCLMPLDFPQYDGKTRIEPLAVRTAAAVIRVREAADNGEKDISPRFVAAEQVIPMPELDPGPIPALEPLAPLSVPPPAATTGGEDAGAGTAATVHESALRQAENRLDAAVRNRRRAEDALARFTEEESRGQARREKLRERMESLEDRQATAAEEDPDIALLKREHRAALNHLARLLESSTEEHPFVVAGRRDLRAIERRLAEAGSNGTGSGVWEIRLRSVKSEFDATVSALAGLLERRRRSATELDAAISAISAAQADVRRLESMLDRAREEERNASEQKALDVLNANLGRLSEKLTDTIPARNDSRPVVVADPEHRREPMANPELHAVSTKLEFQALPDVIREREAPPDMRPLHVGAVLGLAAALLWTILRESLSFRFRGAYEARRMVDLPVLAVLPALDPASMAVSSKAMGGTLKRSGGGKVFIPPPAELHEPPRLDKRPVVAVRKPNRRRAAWILALVVLFLAFVISQADVLERRFGGNRDAGDMWRSEPSFVDDASANFRTGAAP